ncbi:MAG: winged helix-turn-helix transcriptional regulator [Rhodobacteraceae bacterium]|nr:winged helix-turn-helix transcriptional regulator [Paracoccaceae bacterium]
MEKYSDDTLNALFQSLADPTQRAVISALGQGPATVSELAGSHDMALPSFLKHIRHLERSGVISSQKQGRTRICVLHPEAMNVVEDWLKKQRRIWDGRTNCLQDLAEAAERDELKNV